MPDFPSKHRRDAGPWVIIEVPMDDEDLLYPSRRRFYATQREPSTEFLDKAHQFTVRKEAVLKANQLMYRSRNTWAEVVPFSMAWALLYAGGAQWAKRIKTEVLHGDKPKAK